MFANVNKGIDLFAVKRNIILFICYAVLMESLYYSQKFERTACLKYIEIRLYTEIFVWFIVLLLTDALLAFIAYLTCSYKFIEIGIWLINLNISYWHHQNVDNIEKFKYRYFWQNRSNILRMTFEVHTRGYIFVNRACNLFVLKKCWVSINFRY